eukprot:TRINITY_DN914_c0_g1_i1.p1 TRINITY_DN914_c0_g1~~TRINITY_DN914_c0_g1_i1.p1  ORF type:complete len:719 (+),score=229.47 TRINITY_DN914_c0_g1_i1:95-2251(+)
MYKGQLEAQRRHGIGTYVYPNSYFEYQGEWDMGQKHGMGKFFVGNDVIEGHFVNGEISGKGKRHYENGSFYKGDFYYGEREGKGEFFDAKLNERYIGEWKGNKRHGQGRHELTDGSTYIGGFENHKRSGLGIFVSHLPKEDGGLDGSQLVSREDIVSTVYDTIVETLSEEEESDEVPLFVDNLNLNCDVFNGQWKNGLRDGIGRQEYRDGSYYEGDWCQDKRHGDGIFWDAATGIHYQGSWANDRPVDMPTHLTVLFQYEQHQSASSHKGKRKEKKKDKDKEDKDGGQSLASASSTSSTTTSSPSSISNSSPSSSPRKSKKKKNPKEKQSVEQEPQLVIRHTQFPIPEYPDWLISMKQNQLDSDQSSGEEPAVQVIPAVSGQPINGITVQCAKQIQQTVLLTEQEIEARALESLTNAGVPSTKRGGTGGNTTSRSSKSKSSSSKHVDQGTLASAIQITPTTFTLDTTDPVDQESNRTVCVQLFAANNEPIVNQTQLLSEANAANSSSGASSSKKKSKKDKLNHSGSSRKSARGLVSDDSIGASSSTSTGDKLSSESSVQSSQEQFGHFYNPIPFNTDTYPPSFSMQLNVTDGKVSIPDGALLLPEDLPEGDYVLRFTDVTKGTTVDLDTNPDSGIVTTTSSGAQVQYALKAKVSLDKEELECLNNSLNSSLNKHSSSKKKYVAKRPIALDEIEPLVECIVPIHVISGERKKRLDSKKK